MTRAGEEKQIILETFDVKSDPVIKMMGSIKSERVQKKKK